MPITTLKTTRGGNLNFFITITMRNWQSFNHTFRSFCFLSENYTYKIGRESIVEYHFFRDMTMYGLFKVHKYLYSK